MAGSGKWKKGCGIGCAVLVILIFIILGSFTYFVRNMGAEYKEVAKSETALIEAHGAVAQYHPPNAGLPDADRVAVFLEVRQAQQEWRQNAKLAFDEFLVSKQKQDEGGPRHFLRLIRATTDMAPSLAGLWMSRNNALMENAMGPGEYTYIYCLAYYSYLGYDPGDGAQDSELDFMSGAGTHVQVRAGQQANEGQNRDAAWRRAHNLMQPLLEAAGLSESLDASWKMELETELELLRSSPLRYPWRDGAPRALADVFRPFRRELEIQYNVAVNPVELIFEEFEKKE